MMVGYEHEEDGKTWLRVEDVPIGDVWDEPISNFVRQDDPKHGRSWVHKRTGVVVISE